MRADHDGSALPAAGQEVTVTVLGHMHGPCRGLSGKPFSKPQIGVVPREPAVSARFAIAANAGDLVQKPYDSVVSHASPLLHRDAHTAFGRHLARAFIAGIDVAHHPAAGIVG